MGVDLQSQVEHFPSACQVLSRCNWTPMHCAAYLGAVDVLCLGLWCFLEWEVTWILLGGC